jgi:alanine racemase
MSLPPTQARIDLQRLSRNVATIRSRLAPSVRVIAVVKADCYGHSDAICAPELVRIGIDMFAVASIEEGIRLRALGIDRRIIVIRPPVPGQSPLYARHDLEPMISTAEHARGLDSAAAEAGRTIRVHLYVDTGMVRNGVAPSEAIDLLRTIDALPRL